jgi:hypothetical protein
MNTIWTKEDINTVVAAFEGNDFVHLKGITFLKITPGSPDLLIQFMQSIVEQSGGACATGLVRSIVASSQEQAPCFGTQFILEHSEDNGRIVPIVSITSALFGEKHSDRLGFVIAHEIGHILNGDIELGNETVMGTPEYLANELRADQFAVAIMGTKEGAKETLGHMYAQVTNPVRVAMMNIPAETLASVTALIKARLDWVI